MDGDIYQDILAVANNYPPGDRERILDAYRFAAEAHKGQIRRSGEPYIVHPVATACILSELGLDADSIMAGLLHDCLEDTRVSFQEIERRFGTSVVELVDGVTRLGKIVYSSKEEEQMEDLRKMFVAMAKDIRVVVIKLADRLHNMRTMKFMPQVKAQEKSLEKMEIYAPLAHRLGMQNIEWELEDLSLQILDPIGYAEIMRYLEGKKEELSGLLAHVTDTIKKRLTEEGIDCEIKSRLKHIYSIYRKMYGQNLSFSEIYDICAVRIIVKELADCYNVFGVIHDLYRPVDGRFKDYISTPKPNGYQSLHTVVIGREGIPFEVQIRTDEMDRTAEYGIAAHWKYKDGLRGKQKEESFAWVRQLLENQQDSEAEDFIKNMKVDLFADEVYVFTPKGDVINLPQGATPIDFAYAIHSVVGNNMVGAKINGRIVGFDYQLQNGEIVDIVTSKTSTGPKRDWLKIAKTGAARNKIKQWYKKERREENIERGRTELERELRIALLFDDFNQEELRDTLLKRLSFSSVEELYASIGYGGITVAKILGKIRDEQQRMIRAREKDVKDFVSKRKKPVANTGVIVEGIDNCMVKFAKCCMPIPGDEIIGFITRGYGVSVHRKDCLNVRHSIEEKKEDGRWIRTEWAEGEKHTYSTGLRIITKSRVGVLADVVTVFSNMKINVSELNVKDTEDGMSVFYLTVDVTGRGQLELLISRLKRSPGVSDVGRSIVGGPK